MAKNNKSKKLSVKPKITKIFAKINKKILVIIIFSLVVLSAGSICYYNYVLRPDFINVKFDRLVTEKTFGTKLSLRYPKTWKMSQNSNLDNNEVQLEIVSISSPDKKTLVVLQMFNKDSNWSKSYDSGCEGAYSDLRYFGTEAILGYPEAEFVSAIGYGSSSKQYDYLFTLTSYGVAGNNWDNVTMCDLFTKYTKQNIGNAGFTLSIATNKMDIPITSKTTIEKYMKSIDYQIAKRIVKSLFILE